MIKAGDLRKGKTIIYEDQICTVHHAQHVAKGNKRSYMQTKLKNLVTGVIQEVRFPVDDRIKVPFMESRKYEFLYQDGSGYVLMDSETYDQVTVAEDLFGDAIRFLKPNEEVTALVSDGRMLGIELPNVVELEVTDAPPVVKGATVTNQPKEAVLETGARVRVPGFIDTGERVRIDTRSGDYLDRAK